MKSSPSKSCPIIRFVSFETCYKMRDWNLRSSERAREIIQNLTAEKKVHHFVTHVWHDFRGVTCFSAPPSSKSENTLQTLPWRVLLVGTASRGLVWWPWGWRGSPQHFDQGQFGENDYNGSCHQSGERSLCLCPTCPQYIDYIVGLLSYDTPMNFQLYLSISTFLPILFFLTVYHHFQYSNVPRQIW